MFLVPLDLSCSPEPKLHVFTCETMFTEDKEYHPLDLSLVQESLNLKSKLD